MIKTISKKILPILICCYSVSAMADSPLWKVSKGDDHLFIGGTIHILGKSDYPLPDAFDKVYKQSELVVLEVDVRKTKSREFQTKIMQQMSYQDGSTLFDKLTPKTAKALDEYLNNNGIPRAAIETFKPGMLASMLMVLELQKLGINSQGVDEFYNDKAVKDKKTLGKLETIDQQIQFLSEMGQNNPDDFIKYSLRDIKNLSTIFSQLKSAWKNGNIEKLAEIGITPLKTDFPDAYQNLLVKRNNAWVPKIESLMKTQEVEMILVGALHLAGEESILKKLQDKGYKVEQY